MASFFRFVARLSSALSFALLLPCVAVAFDYLETFDRQADISSVNTAGWTLLSDTDVPISVSGSFALNDDLNVAKLTTANDANSLFTSTYFYHEHDIAAGESVLQGNFSGQDAGDYLLTTETPATDFGADSIDLRGARFAVDYQHGQAFTSRPVFWFAIILADGSQWTAGDAIATVGDDLLRTITTDPISTGTEFRRILAAGSAPGQRLRLADTPSFLSEAQLMAVRAVGLYVRPGSAGVPSRFDDFRLEGYGLSVATTATMTFTRTGTIYIDEADPDAFAEYWDTSVPMFSPLTGELLGVELSLSANWTGGYAFQNSADGAAGNASFTPHPYLWVQTRLPGTWSFSAETTAAAQLQAFDAGSGGTATDSSTGTVLSTISAPLEEVSKFIGSGTTVLDIEIRNDSLYENLSATPDAGTFVRAIEADFTLTVTYTYVPAAIADGVIFVNPDATGAGDGSSWTNAFTDLSPAIAAALPGNELWVAEGTYHPAAPGGDRTATFSMRGGVSWYGGFAGDETARDQRDPDLHPTILSGDLNEDDGGGTGVNASWYYMGENSYHVVTATNLTLPATLDGFTVTRGWSWQSSGNNSAGAGMFAYFCDDLRIAQCQFTGNLAHSGAALYTSASKVTILRSDFTGNLASDGRGGAIYHTGDWRDYSEIHWMHIHDSTFVGNVADVGAGPGDAGAIWSSFRAPVEIDRCLFENNQAKWRFTYGSMAAGGGAMLIFGEGSRIANTTFRGNRAHIGGAIWLGREATIVNCLFVKNEAFRQSVGFYDYGGYAGAIYVPGYSTTGHSWIDHCTFHANTARNVGGVWGNPNLTITNSILYTNTATEVEATLLDQQLNGDPDLHYSCVKGLNVLQNGNINTDPLFVDEDGADNIPGNADDDLHLNNGSACIDAGDNAAFPIGMPSIDFDGAPRFQDDPLSFDRGSGTPPLTDMGAFEFVPGSGTGTGNALPFASFTHAIDVNTVTFTDTSTDSDGSIVQWIWDFGDGSSSNLQNPVHTYAANGTFTVTLTVRDDLNGTDRSDSTAVTVAGLVTGSVTVTAPAANETVAGIVAITVETTPDIVRVKLYLDGVYTNQKDESAPFAIDWDSTGVADGLHTIEMKTNDATDTDEGVFWTTPITVMVQNTPPPTALETWSSENFTAAELANPALEATDWGLTADADKDGLTTDVEFALGTDPHDASDADGGVLQSSVPDPFGPALLTLTFRRRNDDPDLTVEARLSGDLQTWSSDSTALEIVSILDQQNGYEVVTVKEVPPSTPRDCTYIQLRIERTAP